MRRIKDIPISIGRLKQGNWYKVHLKDYRVDKFWVARFHSINVSYFYHKNSCYLVKGDNYREFLVNDSDVGEPLCDINEITIIESIDLSYIRSLGIEI